MKTMKTANVYYPISVSERMPSIANENYLTISNNGIKTARFFNGNLFETAHYDGEITHWLEEREVVIHRGRYRYHSDTRDDR